jgi:hypothetical protein
LGQGNPEAKDAVPALAALLNDADKDLRKSAVVTLGRIAMIVSLTYERDDTSRHNLEKVLETLNTQGEPSGGEAEATTQIRGAIHHLEALEREYLIRRDRGRLWAALFTDWKTWAIIVPAVGLLVLVAVFLVKRLRVARAAGT